MITARAAPALDWTRRHTGENKARTRPPTAVPAQCQPSDIVTLCISLAPTLDNLRTPNLAGVQASDCRSEHGADTGRNRDKIEHKKRPGAVKPQVITGCAARDSNPEPAD